jgi:hypothetical protein
VGRKLLVASLGVAAVSYAGCGGGSSPKTDGSGDVADVDVATHETGDGPSDAGTDATDGSTDDAVDAQVDRQFIGNLV